MTNVTTHNRGFSIVEVLMSLAISATLLTSVAVAIFACTKNFKSNQEQGILTNRTRMVMNTLLGRIRMTDQVEPATPAQFAAFASHQLTVDASGNNQGVVDTGLVITVDASANVSAAPTDAAVTKVFTYTYDPANKQLVLQSGTQKYVLLDGVLSFAVNLYPGKAQTDANGYPFTSLDHATISMQVQAANRSVQRIESNATPISTSITASVYPRRTTWQGNSTTYNEIKKYASAN